MSHIQGVCTTQCPAAQEDWEINLGGSRNTLSYPTEDLWRIHKEEQQKDIYTHKPYSGLVLYKTTEEHLFIASQHLRDFLSWVFYPKVHNMMCNHLEFCQAVHIFVE